MAIIVLSVVVHLIGNKINFKAYPSITSQLFITHGLFKNKVLPILFVLLPDKALEIYTKFLEEVHCLYPELQPDTIVTDFELATLNAAVGVFSILDKVFIGIFAI